MNTLNDYREMTRAEVAYAHLCAMCVIFKNELVKVILADNGISCDLQSLKTDRVFTQIYYLADISDRYKLSELISTDKELSKNAVIEGIHINL